MEPNDRTGWRGATSFNEVGQGTAAVHAFVGVLVRAPLVSDQRSLCASIHGLTTVFLFLILLWGGNLRAHFAALARFVR